MTGKISIKGKGMSRLNYVRICWPKCLQNSIIVTLLSILCNVIDHLHINYEDGLRCSNNDFQTQGVVSRMNESNFCEVRSILVLLCEKDSSLVRGFVIVFNARTNCAMGPHKNPMNSKLYVDKIEYAASSVDIITKVFYQVIGSITFLIPEIAYISKQDLSAANVKFRYGDVMKYSKVHLLMPNYFPSITQRSKEDEGGSFDMYNQNGTSDGISPSLMSFGESMKDNREKRCPHCLNTTIGVSGEENEVFDCGNCFRTKEGKHWHCDNVECTKSYCFECLSASYMGSACGFCSSKRPLLRVENGEYSLNGWIRYCDNCSAIVSQDGSQLSSYYKHCDNCNFNLCRSCAFHPNRKYGSCPIDESLPEKFELKLKGHSADILSIHVAHNTNADSCLMISTSKDCSAIIWDMKTGWLKRQFKGHSDWIRDGLIVYHYDIVDNFNSIMPYAVTVSDDGIAYVWDIYDESIDTPIALFKEHSDMIFAVGCFDKLNAFEVSDSSVSVSSTIRNAIISAGNEGIAYVWDLLTGTEYPQFRIEVNEPIYTLTVARSTKEGIPRIVFGTPTRAVMYGMTDVGFPLMEFNTSGVSVDVVKCFIDENGEDLLLATSKSSATSAMIWNLNTGSMTCEINTASKFSSVTIYKQAIVAGCANGEIVVWDKDKRKDKKSYAPNQFGEVTAVAAYDYSIHQYSKTIYRMLVCAVDNGKNPFITLMRYDRIGDDYTAIITTKDITADIPLNVFNQGLIKTVICPLERERDKRLIGVKQFTFNGIPLIVVATAGKFSVIDFYTGTVLFEHITRVTCTAIAVIPIEKDPLVILGGSSSDLSMSTAKQTFHKHADLPEHINHLVGVFSLVSGKILYYSYWETSIESMIGSIDISGRPIVVTAGYAAFHHKQRRIIHWDIESNRKSIINAKEYGNYGFSSDDHMRFNTSESTKKAVFCIEDKQDSNILIEISGSGLSRGGLTLTRYTLPTLSLNRYAIVEQESEMWAAFRLHGSNITKIVSLKPCNEPITRDGDIVIPSPTKDSYADLYSHGNNSESFVKNNDLYSSTTSSRKRRLTRQIIVYDVGTDELNMSKMSTTHLISMRESTDRAYLMNAYGEKDLEYVAFVYSIDKSHQIVLPINKPNLHAHKIATAVAEGSSSKFGISKDGVSNTHIQRDPNDSSVGDIHHSPSTNQMYHSSSKQILDKYDSSHGFKAYEDNRGERHIKFEESIIDASHMFRVSSTTNLYSNISNASNMQLGRSRIVVYDIRSKKLNYQLLISNKVSSVHFIMANHDVNNNLQKEPLILLCCDNGEIFFWNYLKRVEPDDYETNFKKFREGMKEKLRRDYWLEKMIFKYDVPASSGASPTTEEPEQKDDITMIHTMPGTRNKGNRRSSAVEEDKSIGFENIGVSRYHLNKEGIKTFDAKYWNNNQKLMYEAADKKIESYIKDMQPFGAKYVYIFSRAMDIAINNKNPRIVKILLDFWVILLNAEVSNKVVTKDWFHRPSMYLHSKTLLQLVNHSSKVFIKEFANFICAVKLVRSPEDLQGVNESWAFHGSDVIIGGGEIYADVINIWRDLLKKPSRQALDPFFIPLKDAASIEMLEAYVRACEYLGEIAIFKSPVGKYATKFAWEQFGYRTHIIEMFKYLIFQVLFTAAVFNFQAWKNSEDIIYRFVIWILEIIVVISFLWYIYDEFSQIKLYRLDNGVRDASIRDYIHNYQPSTTIFGEKIRIYINLQRASMFYYPSLPIKYVWNSFWSMYTYCVYPIDIFLAYASIYIHCHFEFILLYSNASVSLFDDALISKDLYSHYVGYNSTIKYIPAMLFVYIPLLLLKMIYNLFVYLIAGIIVLLFKLLFLELLNIRNITLVYKHFKNWWNIVDVVVLLTGLSGTIMRFLYRDDTVYSRSLLAVASVVTWLKVLYYLRPFESTGRLVSTIIEMVYQIRFFILILGIAIVGFAQGFWLLMYLDPHAEAFHNVGTSLLDTYYLMLGQYPDQDMIAYSVNSQLLNILQIIFTLFVTILMLNLLIALMTDAYGKIRDNGEAQWRFDQATIILEEYKSQTKPLSPNTFIYNTLFTTTYKPYIHVLKSSQVEIEDEEKRAHLQQFNELQAKLTEIETKLQHFMKASDPQTYDIVTTSFPDEFETPDDNHSDHGSYTSGSSRDHRDDLSVSDSASNVSIKHGEMT